MWRYWLASLTVGLVLLLAPRSPAQEGPQAILDKAIKAQGGAEKLAKIKAVRTKSKGSVDVMGGVDYTDETTMLLAGKIKIAMDLDIMGQKVNQTLVFDGTKGWIKVAGMVIDMDDKLLGIMKDAVYMAKVGQLMLHKDKGLKLSALGEVKVNGRPAVGVTLSTAGQKDVNMYFDKETGLVAKMEHRTLDYQSGQEVAEERIILEYQDVDGMKVAKKVLVNRDGKKFVEAEVLEVKFPDQLDDSEFAKP
jgi:hypothetical protein